MHVDDRERQAMAIEKKAAGEAQQRPRPTTGTHHEAPQGGAAKPHSRPAGIAPTFDVQAMQIVARAGPHKGMISNPWVKHWRGQGPGAETGQLPRAIVAAAHGAVIDATAKAASAKAVTTAASSKKSAGAASVKGRAGAAPKPKPTKNRGQK